MFTKRIIPCLDVHNGRVVKGVNFVNLRDAGDPVEIGAAYDKAGADELVFLDITASSDARNIKTELVRKVAERVFIPFTVGGGIRTVEDFRDILREGADKVAVNSAAIMNPTLISDAAYKFGSQCVVVAIDAKRREDGSGWNIYKNGGRVDMGIDAVRSLGDTIKDKEPNAVAVFAIHTGDKLNFLAVCGKEAVKNGAHAGNILREVSAVTGGKGGGRPDSAMSGGKDISKIGEALAIVADLLNK